MLKNNRLHTFTKKTKNIKTCMRNEKKIFKMTIIKEYPIKQCRRDKD